MYIIKPITLSQFYLKKTTSLGKDEGALVENKNLETGKEAQAQAEGKLK